MCCGRIGVLEDSLWWQCGKWHVAERPFRKIGGIQGEGGGGCTKALTMGLEWGRQISKPLKRKNPWDYRWTERKRKLDNPQRLPQALGWTVKSFLKKRTVESWACWRGQREISFGAFSLHVVFPSEDEQRCPQLSAKLEISWGWELGGANLSLFTFPLRDKITRPHPEKKGRRRTLPTSLHPLSHSFTGHPLSSWLALVLFLSDLYAHPECLLGSSIRYVSREGLMFSFQCTPYCGSKATFPNQCYQKYSWPFAPISLFLTSYLSVGSELWRRAY